MDILKKIEQFREEEQRLKWEGTFAEYLEILKEKGHAVGEPTVSVAGGIIVPVDEKTLNESEIFKLADLPA